MKVLRDKKQITLTVAVGEMKEQEIVASASEKSELGVTVQQVTPEIAESLGLERPEGVGELDVGLDQGDVRVLFRTLMSQEGRGRRSRYALIAAQIEPE